MMFPVIGFYCSLCKLFCGDFEDSSAHLKSDEHNEKYDVSFSLDLCFVLIFLLIEV